MMVVENEEDCGPRVTASVIASHFGSSTAHFKLRLNLPCYLLASTFFSFQLCAVRRIAFAAYAQEKLCFPLFSCGESPRRNRACPRPLHGKRPALSTSVLVEDGENAWTVIMDVKSKYLDSISAHSVVAS